MYKNKRLSDMKDKQLYEAYPTSFLNEERPITVEQHIAVLGHITRLLQSIMPSSNQEPNLFTEYLHKDDLSDITMFITEKYYGLSQELKNQERDIFTSIIGQESWVTLPANGESSLSMWTDGSIYTHDYLCTKEDGAVNKYLYLVSNDVIAKGDYVIRGMRLFLVDDKPLTNAEYLNTCPNTKKVIATTNKNISTCSNVVVHPDNTKAQCVRGAQDCCGKIASGRYMLPQIPESFIKIFVANQGKVGNVTIELEPEEIARPHQFQKGATIVDTFLKVKLNIRGEIILNV